MRYVSLLFVVGIAFAGDRSRTSDYISALDDVVPQIIFGGEWQTKLMLHNAGDTTRGVKLVMYDNTGQQVRYPVKGVGLVTEYELVLRPKGSGAIEIEANQPATVWGWGLLKFEGGGIAGTVSLRNHNPLRSQDFEIAYRTTGTIGPWILPFDQSNYQQMVLMIARTDDYVYSTAAEDYVMEVLNRDGAVQWSKTIPLRPREAKLINFAQLDTATWQLSGTLIVRPVEQYGGFVTVSALRINETGSFTPIEATRE